MFKCRVLLTHANNHLFEMNVLMNLTEFESFGLGNGMYLESVCGRLGWLIKSTTTKTEF